MPTSVMTDARGRRRPLPAPSGAAADGFTLIGLMVLIAAINIGLAVAVTAWSTVDKRAKEAELIWRGQQYVRALQCHRQQTGALPDELDELLESDCIRALYPDPMSRDGIWRVIRESDLRNDSRSRPGDAGRETTVLDTLGRQMRSTGIELPGDAGFGSQSSASGAAAGTTGGTGDDARTRATEMNESLQSAYERLRNLTERLRQDFGSTGNGIVGVVSRSPGEALRSYEGEVTYDAWRFVAR